MGNGLVYESKGCKKSIFLLIIVIAIISFGISISDLSSINAKSDKIEIMIDNQATTIGGRDMLTEEGKQAALLSGIFSCFLVF